MTKNTLITNWTKTATQALPIAQNASGAASAKKESNLFAILAFQSLQVMLGGDLHDRLELKRLVSKEGPFQALRQCVSNAKPISEFVNQAGFIQYTDKESGAIKQFDKEAIIKADQPLFSVATVYKRLKELEGPTNTDKELSDDKAASIYAKANGLTLAAIKSTGNAADFQMAVMQGRALHDQEKQDEKRANIGQSETAILAAFADILAIDKDRAQSIVNAMQVMMDATTPQLVDDMDTAQAA